MTTHKQKTRVYYSSVVPGARQESHTGKDTALLYFFKNKAFQKTVKQKSYAEALKFGKFQPVKVNVSASQCQEKQCVNVVKQKAKTGTSATPVSPVNVTKRFTKINKRECQKPITLHNRFNAF